MVLDFGILFSKLFKESTATGQGFGADEDSQIVSQSSLGKVPLGGVIAIDQSINHHSGGLTTEEFQSCNGGLITDKESPFYGKNVPNLNSGRFLCGGASGATGGSSAHTHTIYDSHYGGTNNFQGNGGYKAIATATDTNPLFYAVEWFMRIK